MIDEEILNGRNRRRARRSLRHYEKYGLMMPPQRQRIEQLLRSCDTMSELRQCMDATPELADVAHLGLFSPPAAGDSVPPGGERPHDGSPLFLGLGAVVVGVAIVVALVLKCESSAEQPWMWPVMAGAVITMGAIGTMVKGREVVDTLALPKSWNPWRRRAVHVSAFLQGLTDHRYETLMVLVVVGAGIIVWREPRDGFLAAGVAAAAVGLWALPRLYLRTQRGQLPLQPDVKSPDDPPPPDPPTVDPPLIQRH